MSSLRTPFEYPRKLVHLLSLFVPAVSYFSLPMTQGLLVFFIAFYSYTEWRKLAARPSRIQKMISVMHRDHEHTRLAKAPLLLALGVLVAISFFSWKAALLGIYQVGFCDTVAAFCGKKWGRTKIPFFDRKTIIGSVAFFFAAFPMGFFLLPASKAIVVSLFGAFLESLPFKDWDNFTIPVVIAFLAENFLYW